ncbi:hypothetical protein QO034_19530 [Sedimentitalea sp. JM2-8]|uniref:Transposase n=1 Tax=Sedimentitalea xiamensis TaxID=3050037 RepID=A0ABT7FJF6_9RHOB|nr:hypothetical protein [Sedimentitalea xiamensis]MDK3075277.1 hypothetical protein [Sedimentitalea xiamensis]
MDSIVKGARNGFDPDHNGGGIPEHAKFAEFAAVHSCVSNHFNLERHLCSRQNFKKNRTVALAEWRQFGAEQRAGLPSD